MATARPPGRQGNTPQARIGFDYSQLRNAPNVAREAGRATARELSQAFRALQNEQRLALEQARQTTITVRTQQGQISAAARAESAQRIAQARAEAAQQQQAARVAAAAAIEEERRKTAAFRSELRQRERAQRTNTFAAGGFGQLAGAFGVGFGAAQVVRAATANNQLAVAYDRQYKAAIRLAGGQQQLNELLEAYNRATGGTIDDATALANVLSLQSVGFAKNAEQLERFVLATRGSAMAGGRPLDQVIFFTQMEILNATNQRLNEIGLSFEDVQKREEELRRTTKGLTDQQIRAEAILGLLIDKYGELAQEPASAVEELGKTWNNQNLAIGQATRGVVDFMATGISNWLKDTQRDVNFLTTTWQNLNNVIRNTGPLLRDAAAGGIAAPTAGWRGGVFAGGGSSGGFGGGGGTGGFGGPDSVPMGRFQGTPEQQLEQQALVNQRWAALNEITRNANRALLETQQQYEEQRSRTIRSYERSRAEEAEDFVRRRANAERDHQRQLLDVQQNSARQRLRWEAELNRNIAEARSDYAERIADLEEDLQRNIAERRADSAERIAEWEVERDRAIEERRQESNERLAELEEDYLRRREELQRDIQERIANAAARFDAVALERERRQAQQQLEALETAHREAQEEQRAQTDEDIAEIEAAHRERLDKEQAALNKSIRQLEEAHRRRLVDEAYALAKSIRQLQEAHQRRLDEQAENDRLRLEEMQRAFEEQKRQEDEERRIRLERQAAHHAEQLAEMDRQHAEDIQQIKDHAQAEREQVEEEFKTAMVEAGARLRAWEEYLIQRENAANASFDRVYGHMMRRFEEALAPIGHPSLADPYANLEPPVGSTLPPNGGGVNNSTSISGVTVAPTIVIDNAGARSDNQLQDIVEQALMNALRTVIPGGFIR